MFIKIVMCAGSGYSQFMYGDVLHQGGAPHEERDPGEAELDQPPGGDHGAEHREAGPAQRHPDPHQACWSPLLWKMRSGHGKETRLRFQRSLTLTHRKSHGLLVYAMITTKTSAITSIVSYSDEITAVLTF